MFAVVESLFSCVLRCDLVAALSVTQEYGLGKEFFLDATIEEALLEGAVVIAVFGIALLVLHLLGFGGGHKKIANVTSAFSGSDKNSITKPSISDPAHKTSKPCASAPEREAAAVAGRHSMQPLDELCSMIRSGQAKNLLVQFDKSLEHAAKKGCAAPEEHLVIHHLVTVLRSCASARRYHDALVAYKHCAHQVKVGVPTLWSLLVYIAAEADCCDLGIDFFFRLCRISEPSGQDFVNMVRCYVRLRNLDGLRKTLENLDVHGCRFDHVTRNKALAACTGKDMLVSDFAEAVAKNVMLDAVGYNTLMKLYAKLGSLEKCIQLRTQMAKNDVAASEVTFGIMLDACVGAGDFERAKTVFAELRSSGVRLNVVHWTTFIKALIAGSCFDEADSMLSEMLTTSGAKPDLITYSTLVKAHADRGNVAAALNILEKMLTQGVKPDEIIFNSIIGSCSVCLAGSVETLQTFETLLKYGLIPSTMTLSILLKALILSKAWKPALDVLATCPQRFNMVPETRLYLQLVQAAMKSQNGHIAVESYKAFLDAAMWHGEVVDPTMSSRLLRQCASSCDHETVSRMRSLAKHANLQLQPLLGANKTNAAVRTHYR